MTACPYILISQIALLLGELADKEAAVQEMQRALETTGMELVAERSKCRALQADVDESAALRDEASPVSGVYNNHAIYFAVCVCVCVCVCV